MATIRNERSTDIAARERLLDATMGTGRFLKASERLREGRFAAEGLSFTAIENGRLVGTVRLWNVNAGAARPALLLGPLAVAADVLHEQRGSATARCCWWVTRPTSAPSAFQPRRPARYASPVPTSNTVCSVWSSRQAHSTVRAG